MIESTEDYDGEKIEEFIELHVKAEAGKERRFCQRLFRLLCSGMSFLVGVTEALFRNMRVDLSCRERGVPEERLNRP